MRQELVAPLVRDPDDEGSELAVQAGGVVGDDIAVHGLGGGLGVRGCGEHARNPRAPTGAARGPIFFRGDAAAFEGLGGPPLEDRREARGRGSARRGHHTSVLEPTLHCGSLGC